MNKDTVAGKVKEVGGEAREKIANITGDNVAKTQAQLDQAEGKVQKNYGQVKDAVNN